MQEMENLLHFSILYRIGLLSIQFAELYVRILDLCIYIMGIHFTFPFLIMYKMTTELHVCACRKRKTYFIFSYFMEYFGRALRIRTRNLCFLKQGNPLYFSIIILYYAENVFKNLSIRPGKGKFTLLFHICGKSLFVCFNFLKNSYFLANF